MCSPWCTSLLATLVSVPRSTSRVQLHTNDTELSIHLRMIFIAAHDDTQVLDGALLANSGRGFPINIQARMSRFNRETTSTCVASMKRQSHAQLHY
jgi:hypothetical protein